MCSISWFSMMILCCWDNRRLLVLSRVDQYSLVSMGEECTGLSLLLL